MSTTELLDSSAPVADEAVVPVAVPEETAGFGKSKKTELDIFAVAPVIKKESRREKRVREEKQRVDESTAEGKKISAHERLKKKHLSHAVDRHEEEDVRTVFVNNLPNNVDRRKVEAFFADCGKIESSRVRCQVLAKGTDGKARGRAVRVLRKEFKDDPNLSSAVYILFEERAAVAKAIEKSGMVLLNRHITVTEESPLSKAFDPKTSVFIGNLSYDTSDEHIWGFFLENGYADLCRVRLVRDRETGQGRGIGYAEFTSAASVNSAIQLRGKLLNGREVRMCHVQKSKDPQIAKLQASRRDARKTKSKGAKAQGPLKKGQTAQQVATAVSRKVAAEDTPAWMGMATNPRKKLDRDLRTLIPSNKILSKEKLALQRTAASRRGPAKTGWDDGAN